MRISITLVLFMTTENLLFKIIFPYMSIHILCFATYGCCKSCYLLFRMYYQVTKQEGAYFNKWRIIPYQHKDLLDILYVATAARNR